MALIPNPRPSQYGGVLVSADGWITGFTRAQPASAAVEPLQSFHFIGVQVASVRAFARLDDGVPTESVNALYPRLIGENPRNVAAFVSQASFLDIGTPRDCLDTSLALAQVEGTRFMGARVRAADSAVLVRTLVWDDVTVGARAHLQDCIVADGARIPDGARFERCAIVPAGTRAPVDGERIDGELLVRTFS
jgi:NDP-sugar pyrophosphorylase family protein